MTDIKLPGWAPGQPIRLLVYGNSKVGKTFGAGTFPRPCFMDFDRGISTLASPDFLKVHGYRQIVYREFYEKDIAGGVVKSHTAYDDACRFFDEMMAPGKRDSFDTWVIDSATTLSEYAQNKAVILLGTKDYGFMSKTHEQEMKFKLRFPRQQDYGAERSLVEQFVDMLLSTDKNIVLVCHKYQETDEAGNVVMACPLLTGKSREAVPLKFDEVYHIRVKRQGMEWRRVCDTQPNGVLLVGSRNSVKDGTDWNYDSVLASLTESYNTRLAAIKAASEAAGKLPTTPAALEASRR